MKLQQLEQLYERLNRREYVHPDPLEFLYRYEAAPDCELVALIASSLAFGRVRGILNSVEAVLGELGASPAANLAAMTKRQLTQKFAGFKYRFVTGKHVAAMLDAANRLRSKYGSLEECFRSGVSSADETVLPAAKNFLTAIDAASQQGCGYLIPKPDGTSACKRLMLMLRWLVRKDRVDPGGWSGIDPGMLIIPLDTHMQNIGGLLGMTQRKSADMKMALEITGAFRKIIPADPVRYDFALTRLGIRDEMNIADLLP
ncbi:MAG: TIGR02757 family protein [Phycisphaerae bacterium]|nr:TIGR02757 family protein [Phycisphaerae bacterium]